MKSDCTHKLNKGEATKNDIVLSLSDVMAAKVADFIKRARIEKGTVVLTGGVTKNSHMIKFIKEKLPDVTLIIPERQHILKAFGASLLAQDQERMSRESICSSKTRYRFRADINRSQAHWGE
jgi:activator of 2-hydroxyglutaryl-CoA dehydratase